MLDHLGEHDAAEAVLAALGAVTGAARVGTPDMGGSNTTEEMAAAVAAAVRGT